MLTEAQKGAMREFYLSIQELDWDLTTLLQNLTTLHEYIIRNIIHEPLIKPLTPILDTGEPPFAFKLENAHSLIESFNHLDLCVSQLSSYISNEDFSARAHFSIRCAKGGLAANDKHWHGVLATNLAAALETWETLGMELRASMTDDSDGLWRRMEENLTSSLFSLVEMHQAIGQILHPSRETESQQEAWE